MKENINLAESVLKRLPIIEKTQALAWHETIDFGDGILVNIDKSGSGTERFYLTSADVDDVYVYPASGHYGPQDADRLNGWGGGNVPIIEKDSDSEELERLLDKGLLLYGIDSDNPIVKRYHSGNSSAILFPGSKAPY